MPPKAKRPSPRAKPVAKPVEHSEDLEVAHATSLLAEVFCGTPRAASSAAKATAAREILPEAMKPAPPVVRVPPPSADADAEDDVWEAESVRARRRPRGEDGQPAGEWEYRIRWVGRPETEDRWVPESEISPDWLEEQLSAAAAERDAEAMGQT